MTVIENLAIFFFIFSIITSITSILLLIRGINIVRQNEIMEDLINEYQIQQDRTQDVLQNMLTQMKEIDMKGSFESDDEVGFVFTQLKDLIESYTEEK
jgi:hypothetical protein